MRQISIPLASLEYIFFHLQTPIMLEKSQNRQSFVKNDDPTSDSAVITQPMATINDKTMKK